MPQGTATDGAPLLRVKNRRSLKNKYMATFKKLYSVLMIMALDAASVVISFGMALLIRFDFRLSSIPIIYIDKYAATIFY